jgi:hypothetical protein
MGFFNSLGNIGSKIIKSVGGAADYVKNKVVPFVADNAEKYGRIGGDVAGLINPAWGTAVREGGKAIGAFANKFR